MKTPLFRNLFATGLASLAIGNSALLAQNTLAFVVSSQLEKPANLQLAQIRYSGCRSGFGYCFRLGDRGRLIEELIEDLRRAGYYNVGNDGYFGPVTERAVRNFQRNTGLTPDGIAGPQTINFLQNPQYWKNLPQEQLLPIPNIYGLSYHEARKKLIDAGWQPRQIKREDQSSVEYGNGPMFIEQGYQELISCSGTGLAHCFFEFADRYGNYLEIRTGGQGFNAGVDRMTVYDLPTERRN
ncbi:MAG: peptidoglycan-binding protein [Oscillatoria sp. PMC 1051.18]|nr:peptidoglycan-binding protein [Oscillatoria sp. PMC 1050.18]MEC5028822.1 peptidoglycan-binding protein [Oscillatoria sp. PMC 1051.18]